MSEENLTTRAPQQPELTAGNPISNKEETKAIQSPLGQGVEEAPLIEESLDPNDVNFTKEDVLLYVFCAVLMIFVGLFFWRTQAKLEVNLLDELKKSDAATAAPADLSDYYRAYLHTQNLISSRRYQHGARILLTTSTRKNTGFMVGTLLALLGCIIVVRRVRKMPITADFAASERAKLRVITSSPGVFVALLGSLIILSTILRYDSFDIADAVIMPPGAVSIPVSTASPSVSPTVGDGGNQNRVLTKEQREKLKSLMEEADQELKGNRND